MCRMKQDHQHSHSIDWHWKFRAVSDNFLSLWQPKRAQIMQARSDGFAVDLFCALEACSKQEQIDAQAGMWYNFIASMREAIEPAGDVINCTWWPRNSSKAILDSRYYLRNELR